MLNLGVMGRGPAASCCWVSAHPEQVLAVEHRVRLRAEQLWKLWEWEMEVITEGTNSPKFTLSGSPPLPPPTFLCLCLWLSVTTFLPLAASAPFQKYITHLKSFFLKSLSLSHTCLPVPVVSLCVHLSVSLDASFKIESLLGGGGGVQVVRHSLQPWLLDHYDSIISSNGGRAADA